MTVGTGVCRLGGRASSRIAVVGDGEPRYDSRAGGGAEVKKKECEAIARRLPVVSISCGRRGGPRVPPVRSLLFV